MSLVKFSLLYVYSSIQFVLSVSICTYTLYFILTNHREMRYYNTLLEKGPMSVKSCKNIWENNDYTGLSVECLLLKSVL